MRKVLIALAAVVGLVAVVAVGGYAALRRGDIPYETLDTRYGSEQSLFLDLGEGLLVHYRDEGPQTGRPVLLLHGYSASLHTWAAWETELAAAGYRVISLDLPGHGLTRTPAGYAPTMGGYADLVETFAQKLGLPGVVLVGSSMGGHTAWTTALSHPARVEGLVLVGAAGWREPGEDREGSPLVFKLIADPFWGPILRDLDTTALARQGLQQSFADPRFATPEMVDRYVELSRAPEHRDVLLRIMTGRDERAIAAPEMMARIKAPTLVLHGEKDNLVPVAGGRRFVETIPGAEGVFYPDVGHLPQEEAAERSAADLMAFLVRHGLDKPALSGAPVVDAAAAGAPAPKALEGVY